MTNPSGLNGVWRVFSGAPHRMMFALGVVQIVLAMVWWFTELLARSWEMVPLPAAIPSYWGHLFLMLYTVFPCFIFGFVFTAYPRWTRTGPVSRRCYLPTFVLLTGGIVLTYIGLMLSKTVLIAAVTLLLCAWLLVLNEVFRMYRRSEEPERMHERAILLALAAGAVGVGSFLFGLLSRAPFALMLAHAIGLWWFIVPVMLTVSHRMIPFFGSNVLVYPRMVRPTWGLPVMLACAAGHGVLEFAGAGRWLFAVDTPLLTLTLYHTVAWGFFRSFRIRLLAMLHIAFLWLSIAFTFYAVQSLVLLATDTLFFARAPLHALAIGFIAGLALAMVSRVTLGHSGWPLQANDLTWYCFIGINAAALVRVAAELPFLTAKAAALLSAVAASIWIIGLLPWAAQFLPVYFRPRSDGRPG